jgi:hypothetical protein
MRGVIALLTVCALGTLAFWIAFFAGGDAMHSSESASYLAFEHAFPVADAWMAGASAVAAIGLARRRAWAIPAGIAAGSALIFLGLLDVTFDVEQGLYSPMSAAVASEIAINVFCLVVGPWLIVWFWRRRGEL